MENIGKECSQCSQCGLYLTRSHVVFGTGAEQNAILLVEAVPSQQADALGEALAGAEGKFLMDMLSIIDLDLGNVYVTSLVKCRPPMNRVALAGEKEACIPWLRRQTGAISPKIIVCLGEISAKRLIRPDFNLEADHGSWSRKGHVWMTAIQHPETLLKDGRKRPETFRDLLKIQSKARDICPEIFQHPG